MKTPLQYLYSLKSSTGTLSWPMCNRVNSELIKMEAAMIPADQIENVRQYLCSVLVYESSSSPTKAKSTVPRACELQCLTSQATRTPKPLRGFGAGA